MRLFSIKLHKYFFSNEIYLFYFNRAPLHAAVKENNSKIVQLLLSNANIDVNIKSI